jgi:hypothetical protein
MFFISNSTCIKDVTTRILSCSYCTVLFWNKVFSTHLKTMEGNNKITHRYTTLLALDWQTTRIRYLLWRFYLSKKVNIIIVDVRGFLLCAWIVAGNERVHEESLLVRQKRIGKLRSVRLSVHFISGILYGWQSCNRFLSITISAIRSSLCHNFKYGSEKRDKSDFEFFTLFADIND